MLELHMPIVHQKQRQWTPQQFERWARKFGASTEQFVIQLMQAKKVFGLNGIVQPDLMLIRKQTVEHPFGTIKCWMGMTHLLTRRF